MHFHNVEVKYTRLSSRASLKSRSVTELSLQAANRRIGPVQSQAWSGVGRLAALGAQDLRQYARGPEVQAAYAKTRNSEVKPTTTICLMFFFMTASQV
jgi:hypothetical protein